MEIKNPTKEQIPMLRTLWQEAFGDTDSFLDLFFQSAFDTKRAMCIVENTEVLAALYWFDCIYKREKVAYIYAVATKKQHRGRGLCTKLMKSTHENLHKNGYKIAVLVPGNKNLFDMYGKMGYKTCSFVREFEAEANGESIELTEIQKNEYTALRRKFLPENSVIQENENMDFLAAYAKFYKGEDFLFAAHKDGTRLIVSEILGNTKKASYIVNTLGCKKGFFRSAGNEKPFSMHYNLSDSTPSVPKYFGLAFD